MTDSSNEEDKTDQKAEEERSNEESEQNEDAKNDDQEKDETPRGEGDTPTDEHISTEKECPECGAPIENLRANCPKCGYEYQEDDYDEPDAGEEFVAGSNVGDEGEEVTDEGPGVEEGAE